MKRHNLFENESIRKRLRKYSSDSEDYTEDENSFTKIKKIRDKIEKSNITYEKVLNANFSEEDTIWFIEHLDMLNNLKKYTEEYYKLNLLIKEKYNNLIKNIDKKEKLAKLNNNNQDIITRILNCEHNDHIKSVMYQKLKNFENLEKNDEYHKTIEWIETILSLPTKIKIIKEKSNIADKLYLLRDTMNKKLYGLNNVKERILETFCAMNTNPYYKKKFIALVGPPGVGKTALSEAIAECMDLPFTHISMGGLKDPAMIVGHSLTYIGAKPGIFVNILRKTKILNSVVLLDEIDKIGNDTNGESINSILLHILDKTQNNKFQDMYVYEMDIDLSNIFFILSLNDETKLDSILRDRIHIVRINGYNLEEKIKIAKKYILPKILHNLGFSENDIKFPKEIIAYLINKTKKEEGVRELERNISSICEKINLLRNLNNTKRMRMSYDIANLKFPFIINKECVDKLL
jgi:ATP-dependent Lon protease